MQPLTAKTEAGAALLDEHVLLDDNKYIADVLYEFRSGRQREYQQSKLLFKKRMFRETDETITEPQFINLSYVQVGCRVGPVGRTAGRDRAATYRPEASAAWPSQHGRVLQRQVGACCCKLLTACHPDTDGCSCYGLVWRSDWAWPAGTLRAGKHARTCPSCPHACQ